MESFKGKNAVITGAGSGIGRELARQLAAEGANLAISDINESALGATVALIGENTPLEIHHQALDVSDRTAFSHYVCEIVEHFGKIDAVFNNAGVANRPVPVESMSYEDYEQVINVNLWGVIHGCHEFIPQLIANPGSHLVNISSVFGIIGPPDVAVYSATKFAVRGYTESLISDLEPRGVKVTCVHPGMIATNIVESADASVEARERFAKQGMPPRECARQILEAARRGKRRVLVGRDAKIIDLVQRVLPTRYRGILARLIRLQNP